MTTDSQALKFILTGVATAALYFLLSFSLVSNGVQPFAGGLIAYSISLSVSYTIQHGWTFSGRAVHRRALPRYLVLQLSCAVLSGITCQIAVSRFNLSYVWMSAVATLICGAVSYFVSKSWVFRDA